MQIKGPEETEIATEFENYRSDEGYEFQTPNRADLLRKPVSARAE
jgi:hypothetical protein